MTAAKKRAASRERGGANPQSHTPATHSKAAGTASLGQTAAAVRDEDHRPPRPEVVVPVGPQQIPARLKKLDRWCMWKHTWDRKRQKWSKVPYNPTSGRAMDATRPNNGYPFAACMSAYQRDGYDGIGFLLGLGQGGRFGGIDVDDCFDEQGTLDERGERISKRFATTYAERSPGGTGFKVLVELDDGCESHAVRDDIEAYADGRYFTVTGELLLGHAPSVGRFTAEFKATVEEIDGSASSRAGKALPSVKPRIGMPMKLIREMLEFVAPEFYSGTRTPWLYALMGLHHETGGSENGLAIAHEFSARDPSQYTAEEVEAEWASFNRTPHDDRTIRTLIQSAILNGWQPPRSVQTAMEEFAALGLKEGKRSGDGALRVLNPLNAPPRVTRDILSGPIRLPDEPEFCIVFGESGSFKSVLTEAHLVHIAAGVTLDGREVPPHVVIYAAEEAPVLFDNNLHAWRGYFAKKLKGRARTHALDNLARGYFQRFDASIGGIDEPKAQKIAEIVVREKARLGSTARAIVALDPVAEVLAGDENSTYDMRTYIAAGRVVQRDADALVVHVHHTGHGTNQRERGNSSFPAAAFVRYGVERLGGPGGMSFKVSCKKWKGSGTFPIGTSWNVLVEDLSLFVPDIKPGEHCSGVVVECVGPTPADSPKQSGTSKLGEQLSEGARLMNEQLYLMLRAYVADPAIGRGKLEEAVGVASSRVRTVRTEALTRGWLRHLEEDERSKRAEYGITSDGRKALASMQAALDAEDNDLPGD